MMFSLCPTCLPHPQSQLTAPSLLSAGNFFEAWRFHLRLTFALVINYVSIPVVRPFRTLIACRAITFLSPLQHKQLLEDLRTQGDTACGQSLETETGLYAGLRDQDGTVTSRAVLGRCPAVLGSFCLHSSKIIIVSSSFFFFLNVSEVMMHSAKMVL